MRVLGLLPQQPIQQLVLQQMVYQVNLYMDIRLATLVQLAAQLIKRHLVLQSQQLITVAPAITPA